MKRLHLKVVGFLSENQFWVGLGLREAKRGKIGWFRLEGGEIENMHFSWVTFS